MEQHTIALRTLTLDNPEQVRKIPVLKGWLRKGSSARRKPLICAEIWDWRRQRSRREPAPARRSPLSLKRSLADEDEERRLLALRVRKRNGT